MDIESQKIDYLNRQPYIDQIRTVLDTLAKSQSSCTFALDGEWGSGKTFVLNMLEEQIKNEYLVIRYNAWENDFYEEPLIAILYTFANKLNERNTIRNTAKGTLKYIGKRVGNKLLEIIGEIAENRTGINAVKVVKNAVNIVKAANEQEAINVDFNPQANIKEIEDKISKELNRLSQKTTIVVLVDELDRCLPEYSITVLERLHHIFNNVNNTQVLLSLSVEQLSNTVAKLFEFEETSKKIKVDSYFKKFFSFKIFLNEGNSDESKRDERFKNYSSKFSIQFTTTTQKDVDDFKKKLFSSETVFENGVKFTGFNARQQCLIIEKANLIHDMICGTDTKLDKIYMCAELLLTVFYHEIWEGKQQHDEFDMGYYDIIDNNYYFIFLSNIIAGRVHQGQYASINLMQSNDYKNNYTIECDDIWGYLWYALFTQKSYTEATWHFKSTLTDDEKKRYQNHISAFIKLLKIIR